MSQQSEAWRQEQRAIAPLRIAPGVAEKMQRTPAYDVLYPYHADNDCPHGQRQIFRCPKCTVTARDCDCAQPHAHVSGRTSITLASGHVLYTYGI